MRRMAPIGVNLGGKVRLRYLMLNYSHNRYSQLICAEGESSIDQKQLFLSKSAVQKSLHSPKTAIINDLVQFSDRKNNSLSELCIQIYSYSSSLGLNLLFQLI